MTPKLSKAHKAENQDFRRSLVSDAVASALLVSALVIPTAIAQESEDKADVEVITVTATKRNESIQEAALAITALSSEFIEDMRLDDVKSVINYTPGVTGNSADSFLDSVSIRGVRTDDYGAGGDLSVGFFKNDLYEGRIGSAVSSFFDMDRSEVARGPQGFLFGRNAIGGAISSHTARADLDSSEKYFNAEIGEYSRIRADGAINVPISDNFAMRFAGMVHTEEPFMTNLNPLQPIPDTDTKAFRWSTTYESDSTRIYTMAEYEDRQRPGTVYRAVTEGEIYDNFVDIWGELDIPDDPYTTNIESLFGNNDFAEILNLQVRLEKDFENMLLTVNAGYKDHDYEYSEDYEGSPFLNGSYGSFQTGDYSQIEARLNSTNESRLSWYAGVSYYKENLDFEVDTAIGQDVMCQYAGQFYNYYYYYATADVRSCAELAPIINYYFGTSYAWNSRVVTESARSEAVNKGWAAYINFDYQITDTLNTEFGIRRTKDDKEIAQEFFNDAELDGNFWGFYFFGATTAEPILGDDSWSDTSIRALLRWRPTDERMFYVSFTEGYKSGGFTTLTLTDPLGIDAFGIYDATNVDFNVPTFGNEDVDSYEFGYKDSWGNNTDVSFTYFYYEYSGLQVVSSDPNGGGTIIQNLGNVDAQGVEFALNTSFAEYYDLYLVYSWLDSEATGVQGLCDFSGPDFSVLNPGAGTGTNDACEGSRVFWAPEHSWAFVLNGTYPTENGYIYGTFDGWWESERFASFDFLPETSLGDEVIFSATAGYESNNEWWVEVYVDNLTDELVYDGAFDGGGFDYMPNTSAFWWPYKPRNFGIRFGMWWE